MEQAVTHNSFVSLCVLSVCVCACVRACVRACARACVCVVHCGGVNNTLIGVSRGEGKLFFQCAAIGHSY